MNKKFKGIISTLLFIAILLFVSFRYGPTDQTNADDNSRSSQVKKITTKDITGVWINHHNKSIHQKITFTKNHKWHENQHGVKDIYSGTWKIIGKRTIKLAPYGEKIIINKHNRQQMRVVNYDHILNKK
ncbi:membrane protein [Companilactobacillus alimentarius]|uniref:DUF5640 domain-containing protein n=1 Tax=Companilactobacillus alimentarius DSM 20249 TaxID=1423720 RepID=A0A2K9HF17_9LACO|nr:hypothetical protein [Companilactobacillus alimentarius]AUI71161.1 hypothetical protein LA20249_02635 [Companilactobacillus alimentarius DSM 20249]KRK75290.1 hypothetical protein FC67_GL001805 [Companilactobacillus alimentarius DSM 20249]MDT6951571.1 hypothetical protein [Companilactobacillus alimentarius]GEO43929.1 membrane protein [Companilactobacillus alimentarius]